MSVAPYLASARLINCQSYRDTTYEFVQGLNILNGTNQIGKSTFYKMLTATVSNKAYARDEWEDLISYNKDSANFLLLFSDYSISLLIVTKKGPRYFYKEDGRDEKAQYIESPKPWDVVREKLGVIVDDETGIILNIVDQDNISRMTLNTSTSPNIINRVSTHEGLENLLATLTMSKEDIEQQVADLNVMIGEQNYIMRNNKTIDSDFVQRNLELIEPLLSVQGKLLNLIRTVGMMRQVRSSFNPKLMSKALSVYEALLTIEDYVETKKVVNNNGNVITSLRKLVNVLGKLEEINPIKESDLFVIPAYQKILSLLEVSSNITAVELESFYNQKSKTEALVKIDSLIKVWDKFLVSMDKEKTVKEEIAQVRGDISLLGREVECPIYGRIQHDGGVCVPLDNGSTLERTQL